MRFFPDFDWEYSVSKVQVNTNMHARCMDVDGKNGINGTLI